MEDSSGAVSTFTGTTNPGMLSFTSDTFAVTFKSNAIINDRGFKATFATGTRLCTMSSKVYDYLGILPMTLLLEIQSVFTQYYTVSLAYIIKTVQNIYSLNSEHRETFENVFF